MYSHSGEKKIFRFEGLARSLFLSYREKPYNLFRKYYESSGAE